MTQSNSKLLSFLFLFLCIFSACKKDNPIDPQPPIIEEPSESPFEAVKYIPPSEQRNGNSAAGYNYLVYGDYLDSGVPFGLYTNITSESSNVLNRTGNNARLSYAHTAVKAANGVEVVTSNCLTCHAQKINGKLVIGLGNAVGDYTQNQSQNISLVDQTIQAIYGETSAEWEAFEPYSRGIHAIAEDVITEVRGVNPAAKLTVALYSNINKHDLTWLGQSQLPITSEVIPSDVPAWWHLKKKNALFHNGSGRGDFARGMIASNGLTVSDSSKVREIDNNFNDVLAYIHSLEAPIYPYEIDMDKAAIGKQIFENKCSTCHGTYGEEETYPNLLVAMDEIGTDPHLARSNFSYAFFVDWYNSSWFAKGENAAYLKPENGYMAPPLDGIWATAPYLHNASVPTLQDVLDSKNRPEKWKRSFGTGINDYDKSKIGWKYTEETVSGSKIVYDSTLPGYGNQGHTYGDDLTDDERVNLIEYMKTL